MNIKEIQSLNKKYYRGSPEEVIRYAVHKFGKKIAFATSLSAEDQVLTEMIASIDKSVYIFTLDTGRLFPHTYHLIHSTSKRYGINIRVYLPSHSQVESMVEKKGMDLFYSSVENRKLCCKIRKTNPLKRALRGKDAWICGLRKNQSADREDQQMIQWDELNGLIKINPLIQWTDKQVWDYIKEKKIPYNPLHDQGFSSIGCEPCTRAVAKGEDIRSGRWWWENTKNKECGLHKI